MAAVLLYLVFVVVVPRLMENRPPMGLKPLIIAYNFILVGISGYMCVEVGCMLLTDSRDPYSSSYFQFSHETRCRRHRCCHHIVCKRLLNVFKFRVQIYYIM